MDKTGGKIITIVVPRGEGPPLLQRLYDRKVCRAALGQARAPVSITRGKGTFHRTVQTSIEKDILTVIVMAQEADDLFFWLFDAAGMDKRHGGFMFMGPAAQASPFSLPESTVGASGR